MKNLRLLIALAALMPGIIAQAQFTYTVNNGAITITGYTGTNDDVTIPSTISALKVTDIGTDAFCNNNAITTVNIPDTVTNIEDYAFCNCDSLTNLNIGQGVRSIGAFAFGGWPNLNPVGCPLTSVTIPNSVTAIGANAFFACASLTNVSLGDSLTVIGASAFSGPINPDPNSGRALGCPLTSIAIPKSVKTIEAGAFANCGELTRVTFYFGLRDIETNSFAATGLTSVTIPNSVTDIGVGAFGGCEDLTNVSIGSGVKYIGQEAFLGCQALAAINVDSNNSAYTSVGGVLFDKSGTALLLFPCGLSGSYNIPFGVTEISTNAFCDSWNLTSVTIPNSVTNIGDDAFYNCSMTNIIIGDSVTEIGSAAFAYTGLASVVISGTVTNIGDWAFSGCNKLRGIYFQGNAPSVVQGVFFDIRPTAYHLPGTTGWSQFAANTGIATALWTLPNPLVLSDTLSLESNQFSFTISWATNVPVVVEASEELSNPIWTPIATNMLNNGTSIFSDFDWTNNPNRFYRLHSQ